MTLGVAIHALHSLLAAIWLGGLVFTSIVVSPAFKRVQWSPADRIAVRSAVGRQYSVVARVNLLFLFLVAAADWCLAGFGAVALCELCLVAIAALLGEMHARVYAPRLALAAHERDEVLRARTLRISIVISLANLVGSSAIVVLCSLRIMR